MSTQPEAALAAARAAIPRDPWRLGALHSVTTLTGSALLALALAQGRITADEAWAAAHVDEDWNMEQWGRDELALERRAYRQAELQAAATMLKNMYWVSLRSTELPIRLPAGHAHVARQRRPLVAAVDDEIVALGLARDRFLDGRRAEGRCLRRRAAACADRPRPLGRGTYRACPCR